MQREAFYTESAKLNLRRHHSVARALNPSTVLVQRVLVERVRIVGAVSLEGSKRRRKSVL
ncbi:MAG: hypothetical protein RhofKO_02720 [Rhodothermales bacterium]